MNRVTGTYRNGSVLLDEPVDWPEGMAVDVCRGDQRNEFCFDGSQCNDTAEGVQKWLDWFDSIEPVLTGEELEKIVNHLFKADAATITQLRELLK